MKLAEIQFLSLSNRIIQHTKRDLKYSRFVGTTFPDSCKFLHALPFSCLAPCPQMSRFDRRPRARISSSLPSPSRFPIWRISDLISSLSFFFCFFQMSDDDRLSLTTAVSDDEETAADPRASSYGSSTYGSRSRSGAAAASFNCTGAVRKAG